MQEIVRFSEELLVYKTASPAVQRNMQYYQVTPLSILLTREGLQHSPVLNLLDQVYQSAQIRLHDVYEKSKGSLFEQSGGTARSTDVFIIQQLELRYTYRCQQLDIETIESAKTLLAHHELQQSMQSPTKLVGEHARNVTDYLTSWYRNHLTQPYPSPEEKHVLAQDLGITVRQVERWFWNHRSRMKSKNNRMMEQDMMDEKNGNLTVDAAKEVSWKGLGFDNATPENFDTYTEIQLTISILSEKIDSVITKMIDGEKGKDVTTHGQ